MYGIDFEIRCIPFGPHAVETTSVVCLRADALSYFLVIAFGADKKFMNSKWIHLLFEVYWVSAVLWVGESNKLVI